jgi:hypothetical protein
MVAMCKEESGATLVGAAMTGNTWASTMSRFFFRINANIAWWKGAFSHLRNASMLQRTVQK